MLQVIQKKLRSQKLLNACLFFGIMILVAVLSLIPMFEKGALDDVILYSFEDMASTENEFPAVISRTDKLESEDFESMDDINAAIHSYTDVWDKYLEIPVLSTKIVYRISAGRTSPSLIGKDKTMIIVTYNEVDKRLNLIDTETGIEIDESLPVCYMPRNTMDDMGLSVGEVLTFPYLTDENDEPISLRIAGIAEQAESDDYYWFKNTRLSAGMVVVREDVFEDIFGKNDEVDVSYEVDEILDYRGINTDNIHAVGDYLEQFRTQDGKFNCSFTDLLEKYEETAMTVKIIIISILIPLLVLLLIFIYMVSDRIRIYEEGEINVLRSRGISRGVIIRQYLLQVALITLAAFVPGVILGFLLVRLGASSVDFLQFEMKNTSVYTFRPEMLLYALGAFPIAGILFIIPIVNASKSTVLTNKGKRARTSGKNFVERYFIDVVILGIAIYLLYNYNKQRGVMIADILSGKSMDPMVLIDAELFTFGAAFLLIRLTRLIITAIYKIRKRRWKPETLAAFLEVIRTRRKSWVISVFMIITIAMGIYNANLAKTVNHNKRERLVNDIGADCVLTPLSRVRPSGNENQAWTVSTVDYSELVKMKAEGLVTEMTQVSKMSDLTISTPKGKISDAVLYGIDTMGFGKSTTFDIMNNDHHWFSDLNALAGVSNGAIISKNMADNYELKVGDSLDLKMKDPLEDAEHEIWYSFSVQIVGVLDTFPAFNRYSYENDEAKGIVEKEKYMIAINQAELEVCYGKLPQEVWMKMSDGTTLDDIKEFLYENEIAYTSLVGMDDEVEKTFSSAMLLITNGLFNVSFIISMIICIIGFLIYWLTSIYSRQLYFGVYRAMGMGMKRINSMLVKEHLLSTMTSLLSSVIVGVLTSVLFTRLISSIYLPEKHSIPLRVYLSYEGFIRIGILMLMALVLCMVIIRRFIKKMNITEAIKLGED